MYEVAKVNRYKVDQDGTTLEIFFPNLNLQEPIEAKKVRKCGVWIEDGRHITADQRKKAYATISDIAKYTGYLPEEAKQVMKYLHIVRTGCDEFSLSSCSIDTAREFINTLMDFAIEHGVPLDDLGINRTDDIGKYLYTCLKYKKCALCGDVGETHHWDAIGMGHDRKKVDDSNHRKICLCRKHHTLAHTIGQTRFQEEYKVYGIKFNGDKAESHHIATINQPSNVGF